MLPGFEIAGQAFRGDDVGIGKIGAGFKASGFESEDVEVEFVTSD